MQDNTSTLYADERPPTSKAWRNDVYEALHQSGLATIAERWLSCSAKFVTRLKPSPEAKLPASAEKVYVCTSNHHHEAEIYSQSCDLRICPECARRHAARLAARFTPKFLELMHNHHATFRFRHITFTTPYSLSDSDIREKYLTGFKQVEQVMAELMSKDGAWKSSQGYLVVAEFGEKGKKLHYHAIHYGQYLQQPELSRLWRKATNDDAFVVDVRAFPYKKLTLEETIHEVLKYVTKFYSKDKITGEITYIAPELLPALAKVLDKTRRLRAYGLFFNVPEPDRSDHLCDTCQAPMLGIPVDYFVTFCNTGMLPREFDHARTDVGLYLKLADNSHLLTSGIPPPNNQTQALRQQQMDWVMKVRQKDDWSTKK